MVDVHPKSNNFKLLTMFLLSIFKGACHCLPQEQKFDLLTWPQLPSIPDEVVGKVPTEEIIHVYMKANDIKFFNT
jgi:hypothetical protein